MKVIYDAMDMDSSPIETADNIDAALKAHIRKKMALQIADVIAAEHDIGSVTGMEASLRDAIKCILGVNMPADRMEMYDMMFKSSKAITMNHLMASFVSGGKQSLCSPFYRLAVGATPAPIIELECNDIETHMFMELGLGLSAIAGLDDDAPKSISYVNYEPIVKEMISLPQISCEEIAELKYDSVDMWYKRAANIMGCDGVKEAMKNLPLYKKARGDKAGINKDASYILARQLDKTQWREIVYG